MKIQINDETVLKAISAKSLHTYATSKGWNREEDLGWRGIVYSKGPSEIFIPPNSDLADYPLSVKRILETLSDLEDRPQTSIIKDLQNVDADIIRIRAPHATDDGTISFNKGTALIQNSREILLSAACSIDSPQLTYRAGRNQSATNYLEKVRLGQTERGSFIFTLESPVPPNLDAEQPKLSVEFEDEPFERRVTNRLAEAIKSVREAVDDINTGRSIKAFEERVSKGVSSNICDSIAKMIESGDGLNLSLDWAISRPNPSNSMIRVIFSRNDALVLNEAARELKDKSPRVDEKIEGVVTHLHRDTNSEGDGDITIKAELDGKLVSIRTHLSNEQYQNAIAAHQDRDTFIVEGDLVRSGSRWRLESPRHISVAKESE